MATFREAIRYARAGGTVRGNGKVIRFLTFAEAEAYLLEQCPSRRVLIDTDPRSKRCGKPITKVGQIATEGYADPDFDLKRLGLYDVSGAEPWQFQPGEGDYTVDWYREGVDPEPPKPPEPEPEVVPPEFVDEALAET